MFEPDFNSNVKNGVENDLVTYVTARRFASYYALHWIGCEYESLVNFSFVPAAGTGILSVFACRTSHHNVI